MINIKEFYIFLSRLSKREKNILYVAVFAVSITIFSRLIISPIWSKIEVTDKKIKEKELTIKRNLQILARKDRILKEAANYASFVTTDSQSEEEEMTFLMKEIENLANKASVYLVDMKPRGSEDIPSAKKYLVNLNCEAQMEQITAFMYDIETSDKLLRIEKYQISPKSKDSSVARCDMWISKISIL